MSSGFDRSLFAELPVVGILRGYDAESVRQLVRASCRGGLRNIEVTMHPKLGSLSLLSQQIGIIGKAAKRKPLRAEDLGIVILPTLDEEPDWDRIEDGDPRYSFVRPPKEQG